MDKFLIYKNRPLVRSENIIYYGFIDDGIVVMLKIIDTITEFNEEIPNNISVSLITTGKDFSTVSIIKTTEKIGLKNALELADIWLTTEIENYK